MNNSSLEKKNDVDWSRIVLLDLFILYLLSSYCLFSGPNRCGEAVAAVRPGPEEAAPQVWEQAHPPHGGGHQDDWGEDHCFRCSGCLFCYNWNCAAIHFNCIRDYQNLIKGECNEFGRMDNNELNRKLIILCPHLSLTSFLCFISKTACFGGFLFASCFENYE